MPPLPSDAATVTQGASVRQALSQSNPNAFINAHSGPLRNASALGDGESLAPESRGERNPQRGDKPAQGNGQSSPQNGPSKGREANMAMISKYVETEVEVEIDADDLREVISEEGMTPGDLFTDAEIQQAAEETADWEGWLEKALEEMSDGGAQAILADHGYVEADKAPAPAAVTADALIQMYTAADPDMRAAFRMATGLDTTQVREALRAEIRREIMAKLFD